MTLAATLIPLQRQIQGARTAQAQAHAARARSANAGTIAAAEAADHELDILLDRLSTALHTRDAVT